MLNNQLPENPDLEFLKGEGFGPPLRVSYRERVSATEVEGDIGLSLIGNRSQILYCFLQRFGNLRIEQKNGVRRAP